MPNNPQENGPEQPEQPSATPQEGATPVDSGQFATAILAGCTSGEDISSHFEALAQLDGAQKTEAQTSLAEQIATHASLLTEPHHWMTLSKGVGRDEYIAILRLAHTQSIGDAKLVISAKLADTLRRETVVEALPASLDEAEEVLKSIEAAEGQEGEPSPETCRALGSAYYTKSFVAFGRRGLPNTTDDQQGALLNASLDDLKQSKEYAERGGDNEGATQSQIRACGVQLDTGQGETPAALVDPLDELVEKLLSASSTWGKRFLKNAMGRRVEAAAKCNHADWETFYDALMAQSDLESHYGGAEALASWKEKNCPPTRQKNDM